MRGWYIVPADSMSLDFYLDNVRHSFTYHFDKPASNTFKGLPMYKTVRIGDYEMDLYLSSNGYYGGEIMIGSTVIYITAWTGDINKVKFEEFIFESVVEK